MTSFNEHLNEKLKDPEFKKVYEKEWAALQREYQEAETQSKVHIALSPQPNPHASSVPFK